MSTSTDNTEVFQILREFHSNFNSNSPLSTREVKFSRPVFTTDLNAAKHDSNEKAELRNIATKLNFSSISDTASILSSSVSLLNESQTPETFKRKLANAEAELQLSKAKVQDKEAYISMIEPANKKMCFSLEQQIAQYKRQVEESELKLSELRAQFATAKSDMTLLRSKLTDCELQKITERERLEKEIYAVRDECSNLKVQLAEVKSEKAEVTRKLNYEIGRLELKLKTLLQEANDSDEYIKALKKQIFELNEKASQSKKLQEELREAQSEIRMLENKLEAAKDLALVSQVRQAELKALNELGHENELLKEELSKYKEYNVALYQEKMWSFQDKLAKAEEKNVALVKLQVENEQLKEKLSEWESLFDDSRNVSSRSPSAFSRKLSQYQKNEVLLTNKLTKLSAHCQSLEHLNQTLKEEVALLKKGCNHSVQNSSQYEGLIKRLKRRNILLTKERDNCRKLIDSYVSENTMTIDALNNSHIKNIEETLAEYKNSLDKAEEEIDGLSQQVKILTENCSKKDVENSEVIKLREENEKLQSANKALMDQIADLKQKVERNENINSKEKGKVIHLKCNPFASAVQQRTTDYQKLKEENDRLRKRVKVLEEEGAAADDVTLKVEKKLESEGSDSLLQSLREQLASAERQNKLIFDTARTKSREFREAVYTLTGYKVDMPTTGKYKLSHVYADSPDDFLLFEVNSTGVQLMETEYSSHLTDQMEVYLKEYQSIPAFLASVTLHLFNQQTYMLTENK